MQQLQEVALPGLMISQTWPTSREKHGDTLNALETALKEDFFTSFQTVEVPFKSERRRIASAIRETGCEYDYCVARVLNENGHNLSDLDNSKRIQSCDATIGCLDDAREAGASSFTVISGPVPDNPERRFEALRCLTDSLRRIGIEAGENPSLRLTIEPLDVEKHKKFTLGFTGEAMNIIRELREERIDVSLLLDSAHITLNDENLMEVIEMAHEYTSTFHYCNCVVDQNHELFGDRHIRFGKPGVLDKTGIAEIMKKQLDIGFFCTDHRRPVMCEVRLAAAEDSLELMRYCRTILERAWRAARQEQ